jgi:hypothetical protein
MCVLIFSKLLAETFHILRINEQDVLKSVYWSSCKININLNFLGRFSKNPQISNLMKIRPVEIELFHADGRPGRRTNMMKQIAAIRKFANAPKATKHLNLRILLVKLKL